MAREKTTGNDRLEQAIAMLTQLSGRMHHVYSSVALVTESRELVATNVSRVCFRPLTREEIENYCGSDEPIGKAGGYAIQGRAAAFIERLEGSYSGVMGLPLYETSQLLKTTGKDYNLPQNIDGRSQTRPTTDGRS